MNTAAKKVTEDMELLELRDLVNELYQAQSREDIDKAEFSRLFNKAADVLELSDRQIAKIFHLGRISILLWKSGEAVPHPVARPSVFQVLQEQAENRIRSNEVPNIR